MKNPSVTTLWEAFVNEQPNYRSQPEPPSGYFGTTKEVADASAQLVLSGQKTGTSHSLIGLQRRGESLPKIGDLKIITDFNGYAVCIVRTVRVRLKPFFSVTPEDARLEGEGDGSLDYWKSVHWDFYTEELEAFGKVPVKSMIIVCEEFEKIFALY